MRSALRSCLIPALLWFSPGCVRIPQPDLGADRSVEAGVPVVWGAPDGPVVEWRFGDGTRTSGAQARHAFARPGRYQVQAFRGAEELAKVTVTVALRPVLRAIPAEVTGVFYLPKLEGELEPATDFLERLAGSDSAQRALDAAVLPQLALELATQQANSDPVVNPAEGLGVFSLKEFAGWVGLVGVMDPDRALAAVARKLESRGAVAEQRADGSVRFKVPEAPDVVALVDRGYLYLVVPDHSEVDPGVAVKAIRGADSAGLEGTLKVQSLAARVAPGMAALFFEFSGGGQKQESVFASVALAQGRLEVDGLLTASEPVWLSDAPRTQLFGHAPSGPVAVFSASASPQRLAHLFLGPPGTPRRTASGQRLHLDAGELDALVSSLSGDLGVLLYFDATRIAEDVVRDGRRPQPRFTLLAQVGVKQSTGMNQLIDRALGRWGVVADKVVEPGGGARYRFNSMDSAIELEVEAHALTLRAGDPRSGRTELDLGPPLQTRFGGGAFGTGHLTAMVDVGQVLKELDEPRSIPGVNPSSMRMFQGFASAMVRQLTSIDAAVLDVAPDREGARFHGTLTLRSAP